MAGKRTADEMTSALKEATGQDDGQADKKAFKMPKAVVKLHEKLEGLGVEKVL